MRGNRRATNLLLKGARMNRKQFKAKYHEYRLTNRQMDEYARNLPCGMQDAVCDRMEHANETFCKKYPVIGQVLENRYADDPLEEKWLDNLYRYTRSI